MKLSILKFGIFFVLFILLSMTVAVPTLADEANKLSVRPMAVAQGESPTRPTPGLIDIIGLINPLISSYAQKIVSVISSVLFGFERTDRNLENDQNISNFSTDNSGYGMKRMDRAAFFSGYFADHGTDINGDKLYDFLTVDVGVNVTVPGRYVVTGYLYDLNSTEVAWSIDSGVFEPGQYTMHLNFDGNSIEKHGGAGQYRLGNLYLSGENWSLTDEILKGYTTSTYKSSEFNPNPPRSKKKISGNGTGELLLTLTINDTAPVYSGWYRYDIMGLKIPPISTPFTVNSSVISGYSYNLPGIFIPGKPNNYYVNAEGVKNLNVGLKKLQGELNRIWISDWVKADEGGKATLETDLISPNGYYWAQIFGDAAENVSNVELNMTVVKKLIVNGRFNFDLDTFGFPSGNYSIILKTLSGSIRFDKIRDDKGRFVQVSSDGEYVITGLIEQ
jgi:hypothetical protein